MRVGKFLVMANNDTDWETAKGILEAKGHEAYRGSSTEDLQQFLCWWGKTTREDRCQVDGVYVVGQPAEGKEAVISPIVAELACFMRMLHNDGTAVDCMDLTESGWEAEMQDSIMRAEDCPDP